MQYKNATALKNIQSKVKYLYTSTYATLSLLQYHTEPKAKCLNYPLLKNSSVNFLKHALPKQVRLSLTFRRLVLSLLLCLAEPRAKHLKSRQFKYIIYYCNIYSSDFSPLKIRLIMTDTQKFLGKSRNLLKNFLIILNLCFIIYLITSYFINIYYNEFLSCQICQ